MKKILYIALLVGVALGSNSCEDKDYELITSATDDYTSETGGDYYGGEGIDVSMYEKARIFPGLVDTLTETRIEETLVEIDLSKSPVIGSEVNWVIAPASIYSTGLYAGAGEKITINLEEDVKGLSVQIGVHSTDLSSLIGNGYVERDARVVTTMPLFKGNNEIRNPYGGYIWIRRTGKGGREKVLLQVKGAYAAPDYIKGKTNEEATAWMEIIKNTTVPWIELRGEKVAFTVPTKYVRRKIESLNHTFVSNVEEALGLWDDWVNCIYEFYGLDGIESDFPVPGYPTRAIMDVHLITERYSYYSNDAVELLETEELIDMMTNPEIIKTGGINIVHLMGWLQLEKYKQIYFPATNMSGLANVYSLIPNFYFLMKNNWWNGKNYVVQKYSKSANVMKEGDSYEMIFGEIDDFISFASVSDTCKSYNWDTDLLVEKSGIEKATLIFISDIINYQQGEKDGWKFWGYFNRYMATVMASENRMMTFEDGLLHALTEYFERDFTPLFDHWGIEVSDSEENIARSKQMIDKCIWQYNPLDKNKEIADYDGKVGYTLSGKKPYHHERENWVAAAYSGRGTTLASGNHRKESTPLNLFDGDRATLWESYYDDYLKYEDEDGVEHFPFKGEEIYKNAKTPELPYTLVISPGNGHSLENMDGFYLAYGNTSEASIYNTDVADYDFYTFGPQHVVVDITSAPLEYDESSEDFTDIESVTWERIYDSDNESVKQFWPERKNAFYIDLQRKCQTVRGIRLTFDRVSHVAKDRPAGWDEVAKPGRPEKTNKNLDRIQKIAEFGTYYY